MEQQWRPHEAAKVKTGKHAGMVGTVVEVRPETGMVRIQIDGVKDKETISELVWLKAGQLEVNQ